MIDAMIGNRQTRIKPIETARQTINALDRLARSIVLNRLQHITQGKLTFKLSDQTVEFGQETPDFPVSATVIVKDNRIFSL